MKLPKRLSTKVAIMITAWTLGAQAEEPGHEKSGQTVEQTKPKEAAHTDHEDHGEEAKQDDHADHSEKGEEGGHAEGEEEEASSAVGPEKGIIEKGISGFKLSPEATKTINFKTIDYTGGTFSIPKTGLVKIKNEKSVFISRQGWIKRIPIEVQSKQSDAVVGKSPELKLGDKIITTEAGFLRMSEVFAEGGASHGHSH